METLTASPEARFSNIRRDCFFPLPVRQSRPQAPPPFILASIRSADACRSPPALASGPPYAYPQTLIPPLSVRLAMRSVRWYLNGSKPCVISNNGGHSHSAVRPSTRRPRDPYNGPCRRRRHPPGNQPQQNPAQAPPRFSSPMRSERPFPENVPEPAQGSG